jgi:hypothetical protein
MICMFYDSYVVHVVSHTGMTALYVLGGGGTTYVYGSRLAEHEERNDQ